MAKKITLKNKEGEVLCPHTAIEQVQGLKVALDEKLGKTEVATSAHKLDVMSFRPTSANISTTDGGLYQFKVTSNMTEGDPGKDGHIIHSSWDNAEWSSQIFLGVDAGMSAYDRMKIRWQEDGVWKDWKIVAFTDSTVASVIDGAISTSKIAKTAITPEKIQTSIALNGTPSMTVEPTTSSPDKTIASVGLVKEAVDGIEIGGVNLILNSDFSQGTEYWSIWKHGVGSFTVEDKIATFFFGATSGQGLLQTSLIYIESGQQYTMSFNVRSDNVSSINSCYLMSMEGVSNIRLTNIDGINSSWQRIEYHFTASQTGNYYFGLGLSDFPGGSFQIKRVKIEKGNKATDWSPAPEDVQANISNAETRSKAFAEDYTNAEIDKIENGQTVAQKANSLYDDVSRTYKNWGEIDTAITRKIGDKFEDYATKSYVQGELSKQVSVPIASETEYGKVALAKPEDITAVEKDLSAVNNTAKAVTPYTLKEYIASKSFVTSSELSSQLGNINTILNSIINQ